MFKKKSQMHEELSLTISLKFNQIQRESLPHLELDHFIDYLFNIKWKKVEPQSLSQAVIEIMNTDVEHMVKYLSTDAIVSSKQYSLSDFDELFGKKNG